MIAAVQAGHKAPSELDEHFRATCMPDGLDLSDSFITTQRTGVIARMSDLDLLRRKRSGANVEYFVTDHGVVFGAA